MRFATLSVLGSLVAASLAAACGSADDTSSAPPATTPVPDPGVTVEEADASAEPSKGEPDAGPGSTTYPAAHTAPPQVVSAGGPVLETPKVLSVFYPSYSFESQITDFSAKIGATDYWKANVSEYGVGTLQSRGKVVLSEAAPTTLSDAQIQTWLAEMLDGTHPEFGTPDSSTIYAIYYPASTSIVLGGSTGGGGRDAGAPTFDAGPSDAGRRGDGGRGGGGRGQRSCQTFGGYHDSITVNGTPVAYAVVPDCPANSQLDELEGITAAASHELIEAATDPFPMDNPAYTQVDDNHIVWLLSLGGGETGDLCAQFPSSYIKPPGFDFVVQRSWSNKAATAGKNPCVPAPPSEVYFNSAPALKDTVTMSIGGQNLRTKGIQIPVGTSKTIDVDLFSEAKTDGPWTVTATEPQRGGGQGSLKFEWDRDTGVNGDKLKLTITATGAGSSRGSTFLLTSTLGSQKSYWFGLVTN